MKILFYFISLQIKECKGFLLGLSLGLMTILSGIGLLSLSGWFISASAFAGLSSVTALSFNYLLPAGGVRFFSLMRIVSRYTERIVTHDTTFKILTRLRVWTYQKLEPLVPAHLLEYRSGDLLSLLVSDIDTLDNLYIRLLSPVFLSAITIVIVFVYANFFNHKLAFFILLSLLLTSLLPPLFSYYLGKKIGKNMQITISILKTKMIDYFQGLMELVIFGGDKKQILLIGECDKEFIKLQSKMAKIKGLMLGTVSLTMGLTIWLLLYYGVQFVHKWVLSGASLALLVFVVLASFEAVSPLTIAFQYLSKTCMAAKRLNQLATSKPAVTFVPVSKSMPNNSDIIINNVFFSYLNREPILKDFTMKIKEGEKIGIIGNSGAGKSTIIHLLTRAFDPKSGDILLGGVSLRDLSEDDLRQSMTVISQRSYIFNATIRHNLLLARPQACEAELWDALCKVQLGDFVQGLSDGLDTWTGENGARLSGGQAKRLVLARAVLHNAPIWFLDEPTEGLDIMTQHKLLVELKFLMKNKTVLMVSHRMSDLINMDRIVDISQCHMANN